LKAAQPDVVKVMSAKTATCSCGELEEGTLCFAKHDAKYFVGLVVKILVGLAEGSDAHIVHVLLAMHHVCADGTYTAAGHNVLLPVQTMAFLAAYIPVGNGLRPLFWKHLLP
jgi:hypothetical protein